jgi:hypothetical protein
MPATTAMASSFFMQLAVCRSSAAHTQTAGLFHVPRSSSQRLLPFSLTALLNSAQPHPLTLQQSWGSQQQCRHLLLMPRRTKYRKAMKRLLYDGAPKSNDYQLQYGSYGIRYAPNLPSTNCSRRLATDTEGSMF